MSVYSNNQLVKNHPNDAWFKIFQFIKPASRVLDVGCSSGKLGAALKKEKKVSIIGLDIDAADVALAKKNLDEAYIGNIEQDDLSAYGQFDYVVMADVIEHLVDPVSAIKKIEKLLKKDGKFIFSIPNMANVTTRLELLKGRFTYKDFGLLDRTHLHFYDITEVNRVLNDAGFVVQDMDCTLREIPKKLLEKELAEVGMELTPELQKVFSQPDATIYQFIGVAVPGKAPKKMVPNSTTPLDIISIEIEELQKAHEVEQQEKLAQIKSLEKRVDELDGALSSVLNSRGWKMLEKVHTIKGRLKPKK